MSLTEGARKRRGKGLLGDLTGAGALLLALREQTPPLHAPPLHAAPQQHTPFGEAPLYLQDQVPTFHSSPGYWRCSIPAGTWRWCKSLLPSWGCPVSCHPDLPGPAGQSGQTVVTNCPLPKNWVRLIFHLVWVQASRRKGQPAAGRSAQMGCESVP